MGENFFGLAGLDSTGARNALERALSKLRSTHLRALTFESTGHARCSRMGGQRHRAQPCTCCASCSVIAEAMLADRRTRFPSQPWPEFYATTAENPGKSAGQWVVDGQRLVAMRVFGLPAKPRLIREGARLTAALRDNAVNERAVTLARFVIGEAAHLGWLKHLDGDESPMRWGWVAEHAVAELAKQGHHDVDLVADDARRIVLDLHDVVDRLPQGLRTSLHQLIFCHMNGDVHTDASPASNDRGQRDLSEPHVSTAPGVPNSFDAVAEIVAARALRTVGPDTFADLDADRRHAALDRTLRSALRDELTARGGYELGILGPDLVRRIVATAATIVAPELARVAAATAVPTADGTDASLANLTRSHYAAWGLVLSSRDAEVTAICADLQELARGR